MNPKQAILIFLFSCFQFVGIAQDVHWSQFDENPLYLNPGNAGKFEGDYRFVGNYRDQWRSVTIPFQTTALSVEKNFGGPNKRTLGFQVFNDVVGDGNFRTNEFLLTGATSKYAFDSLLEVRPAVTIGINTRRFDPTQFYFDNQFNGIGFDPSLPSGEIINSASSTNFTVAAGFSFDYTLPNDQKISGGIALFNLNRPNQSFYLEEQRRDRRLAFNANYTFQIDKRLQIIPSAQLQLQGKYREIVYGGFARYFLENRMGNYKALRGGLWFRQGDALFLTVGIDYQDLFFGISYDINVSKLIPASGGRGGIEFAIRYILRTFKTQSNRKRICPDFI